ncbi:nucleotidyl transferase AbiEii/AbiGii toxin family protein [Tamlana agarivorans]|uniref:Nucleotidyl transferase AbiEii/AbiGii toxin family protein n=1 Tax=Pseudotamlana agarivorans TaxID=481183 RepID=A0ACC5U852_9FLAO|nr:nucleotidyl transferase AbiEii/AbiGii toxin family protein [Tamlana agarivorans]MBU2950460.1 nucleotidyl transferase AbiEii/AbiGii toxin family protein [Tamlana agarivorans]
MDLYLNTVTDLLWDSLNQLMLIEEFSSFRIVGGTALSLQLGHRESIDIDLFTDAEYGSIDFDILESKLLETFPYVDRSSTDLVGMGKSYFVGNNENELIKLDLFYTDPFVFPVILEQGVRFSSLEDIVAMKFEVIAHGGRKKDFWDIHELLEVYTLDEMIAFYLKRNPYGYSKEELLIKILDFSIAEDDFTPNCYRGKVWELIKFDFEKLLK